MSTPVGIEREAIERDRDLAWELFDAQPEHPRIPQLTQSVLARAPQFTGMIILLAMHREACGEVEEARRLLQDLVGRRDRQFVNAVRKLRDLELSDRNYAESLRLARIVLQEDPEAGWLDRMDLGSALVFIDGPEAGWQLMDDAVEMCARTDPDRYAGALAQRALRLLSTGATPERFIPAAEEAIAADPSEPALTTALAYAYLYDYRAAEAEELLRRVLREDPTDTVAQSGVMIARGFLDAIDRGDATMDQHRAAGSGEMLWRGLRDTLFDTGLPEALAALDSVLPSELSRSLRPPLDRDTARASGGDAKILAWHDGQLPGSGSLWGTGDAFRLMSADEITAMDDAIEKDPESWPQWRAEEEYYTQLFTDDAGSYLFEGRGGRLYRRGASGDDREVAESPADWVWDRVVAFGGGDPRPWRATSRAPETGPLRQGP